MEANMSALQTSVKKALLEGLTRHGQFVGGVPADVRQVGEFVKISGHYRLDFLAEDIAAAARATFAAERAAAQRVTVEKVTGESAADQSPGDRDARAD